MVLLGRSLAPAGRPLFEESTREPAAAAAACAGAPGDHLSKNRRGGLLPPLEPTVAAGTGAPGACRCRWHGSLPLALEPVAGTGAPGACRCLWRGGAGRPPLKESINARRTSEPRSFFAGVSPTAKVFLLGPLARRGPRRVSPFPPAPGAARPDRRCRRPPADPPGCVAAARAQRRRGVQGTHLARGASCPSVSCGHHLWPPSFCPPLIRLGTSPQRRSANAACGARARRGAPRSLFVAFLPFGLLRPSFLPLRCFGGRSADAAYGPRARRNARPAVRHYADTAPHFRPPPRRPGLARPPFSPSCRLCHARPSLPWTLRGADPLPAPPFDRGLARYESWCSLRRPAPLFS